MACIHLFISHITCSTVSDGLSYEVNRIYRKEYGIDRGTERARKSERKKEKLVTNKNSECRVEEKGERATVAASKALEKWRMLFTDYFTFMQQ